MATSRIDTMTVLKVLLAIAAAVVAFLAMGWLFRIIGRIVWTLAGLLVVVVLGLLALRLLRDVV